MSFPGHLERLMQSSIDREVTRVAQGIPVTALTGFRIAEALSHGIRIGKHVRRTVDVAKVFFNWSNCDHAGRDLPVGGPTLKRERTRRSGRQSGVPTENPGDVPAAQNAVRNLAGVAEKLLATTERQTHQPIRIYVVTNVEIRIRVVRQGIQRIKDQRGGREVSGTLKTGSIVQRMRQRVVEVKRNVVGQTLPNTYLRGVVIGNRERGPRTKRRILWVHESVVEDRERLVVPTRSGLQERVIRDVLATDRRQSDAAVCTLCGGQCASNAQHIEITGDAG